MLRKSILVSSMVVLLIGCTPSSPEQSIVNDAASAMGGKARIQAVRTLLIEGEGVNYNLGQDMIPGASGQTFKVTEYRRVMDFSAGRMRIEQVRTPNFAYFQGPAPQKQIQGLDGGAAYNVAANGNATAVAATVVQDRQRDFYHHPLTIVRAALDPAAKLANARTTGNERLVDITTANGVTVTLAINGAGIPVYATTKAYHPNLGDVVYTTTFADYKDVNGLKLPAQISTKIDDFTLVETRASKQSIDGDAGDLAVPAAAAAAPAPAAVNVSVEQVAPGVWLLAGQSHHSVVVDFSDHRILIEAPQSEARTLAVIAKAREIEPKKPLTSLVTTHHHFDHTGGLRAAISEGLTVVTQSGNKAFVEAMAGRPHTMQPDALAKNPKQVAVETVDEELELKDAVGDVKLYHVAGSPHSDTMLMAYIPKARILVEVDVFSPGAAAQPYAANLIENITRAKLNVDRIVPLHGTVAPMSELMKTQAAMKSE
jgi:glyoxylase-like metal-dependent hydrolase (beta-lactamase superfamily II)